MADNPDGGEINASSPRWGEVNPQWSRRSAVKGTMRPTMAYADTVFDKYAAQPTAPAVHKMRISLSSRTYVEITLANWLP